MTETKTTTSKLATTKTILRLIATRATSGVVVTLAHQNIDNTDFTRLQKAGVYVGAYLVGSMVADAAADHVSEKFDSIVKAIGEMKTAKSKSENDTTN